MATFASSVKPLGSTNDIIASTSVECIIREFYVDMKRELSVKAIAGILFAKEVVDFSFMEAIERETNQQASNKIFLDHLMKTGTLESLRRFCDILEDNAESEKLPRHRDWSNKLKLKLNKCFAVLPSSPPVTEAEPTKASFTMDERSKKIKEIVDKYRRGEGDLLLPYNPKLEDEFDDIAGKLREKISRANPLMITKLHGKLRRKHRYYIEGLRPAPLPMVPDTTSDLCDFIDEKSTPYEVLLVHHAVEVLGCEELKRILQEYESKLAKHLEETLTSCKKKGVSLPHCEDRTHMAIVVSKEQVLLSLVLHMKEYFTEYLQLDEALFEGFMGGCTVFFFSILKTDAALLAPRVLSHLGELKQLFEISHLIVFEYFGCDLDKGTVELLAPEPQVHHPNDRTEEGTVSDSEYVELLQLRDEVVSLKLKLKEKDVNLKTQQEECRKAVSAYLALRREMKDDSGKEPPEKIVEVKIHSLADSEGQGSFEQKPSLTEQTVKDEMELEESRLKIATLSDKVDSLEEALQEEKNAVDIILEKVAELVEQKDFLTRELFALSLKSTAQTGAEDSNRGIVRLFDEPGARMPVVMVPEITEENEDHPPPSKPQYFPSQEFDQMKVEMAFLMTFVTKMAAHWLTIGNSFSDPVPSQTNNNIAQMQCVPNEKMARVLWAWMSSGQEVLWSQLLTILNNVGLVDVAMEMETALHELRSIPATNTASSPPIYDKLEVTTTMAADYIPHICAQWYLIANILGGAAAVEANGNLQDSSKSASVKMTQILQGWIDSGVDVHWSRLVKAMRMVGMGTHADQLEEKLRGSLAELQNDDKNEVGKMVLKPGLYRSEAYGYEREVDVPDTYVGRAPVSQVLRHEPFSLRDVTDYVDSMASKWDRLGFKLDMYSKVATLRNRQESPKDKCLQIIESAVEEGKLKSWDQLLKILRSDTMKMSALAQRIEAEMREKYGRERQDDAVVCKVEEMHEQLIQSLNIDAPLLAAMNEKGLLSQVDFERILTMLINGTAPCDIVSYFINNILLRWAPGVFVGQLELFRDALADHDDISNNRFAEEFTKIMKEHLPSTEEFVVTEGPFVL